MSEFLCITSEKIVEMQVNRTILGNCLYFNKRNLYDYSKGKTRANQEKKYTILQSLNDRSKELLSGTQNKLLIRIRIWKDSSMQGDLLIDKVCSVCRASNAYTVTWDKEIKIVLQSLFPVSTALAICNEKDATIEAGSFLYESIGIKSFCDNGNGGWNIYPIKQVSDENMSVENRLIISVLKDYSKDKFLNTSPKSKSEQKHLNAFSESTDWQEASQFTKGITVKTNCIYTLASEADEQGKCRIYIGEAVSSGKQLKKFNINGKTYIDHTRKEAEEHEFTRFRVDTLKEDAREFLHDAQDSIIGVVRMLQQECPKGYEMKNKQLCSSISTALVKDEKNRK